MTPPDFLIDAPLSCDDALTVALVVLDTFCGDVFLSMTAEQRTGAVLIVDHILMAHVTPVLEDAGPSDPSAPLLARLNDLHAVADRIRRLGAAVRVH